MHGLRGDCARRGWPVLDIGVGLNTGVMHVGNMGSRYRVAYTVLGDAVNLAARLEALTRLYGTPILASESTRAACPTLPWREVDHVRVKGKGRPTRLYEPLGDKVLGADLATRHEAALAAYYAGAWDEARAAFATLATEAPGASYYTAMAARLARAGTPPPGWDGVVSFAGSLTYSFGADAGGD